MDQKTRLWGKKYTDKVNGSSKAHEDEIHKLSSEKAELETDLKNLNDKLSDAISELYARDDLIKKHEKLAWDAMEGWENAEAKVLSLKQELDEAFRDRTAGKERMARLDAALKECMQQLLFIQDKEEQRIHDAVTKTSREFERSQLILEEKLKDTSTMLARISAENTQLSKALLAKEKSIEDLSKQNACLETDFNSLVTKLESAEKDKTSLKYKVQVLEKEVKIQNEEREFNRRTADASHKQHLESVKKIAKLESECQRLHLLVRKRLPGPAALAKMKNEVEILGRDAADVRRRRSNSNPSGLTLDYTADNSPDAKRINFLVVQLCAIEEENKSLKEALNKKANELKFSRTMYARTASQLSQVESHLNDLSKKPILESSASGLMSHEVSLASMSDIGSDDKASYPESWASALISELEHFKSGKLRGLPSNRTVGASDINLMDDFVEMEKLAIVSVDKQSGSPPASLVDTNPPVGPLEADLNGYSSDVTGKEIAPLSESGSGTFNQEIKSKDILTDKVPSWLQGIVKVIWEQRCVTLRQPDEIMEDVRLALRNVNSASLVEFVDANESTKHSTVKPLIDGLHHSRPAVSPVTDLPLGITKDLMLVDKSNQLFQLDLGKSLCKVIELIEGIKPYSSYGTSESLSSKDGSMLPYKSTETPSGYMVRVIQWKVSELNAVLQQFVHSCYDLLNGKFNVTRFAQELSVALDWIMNHCFSLQDVSSMEDAIKKHYDWDECRSENEAEISILNQFSEVDKPGLSHEQLSSLPMVAASYGHCNNFSRDELQVSADDNKKLKDDLINLASTKKDLEGRLQSAIDKSGSLTNQLQESERTIERLQKELETLRGSKAVIENRIESHKLMKEDLDTQFTVAKAKLYDTRHIFSCLEVELENKNSCCEELEATCLDLQLQLESVKEAIPVIGLCQEEKQLRTDWEITAASEKLAECQETILNLGKQLKALASPTEAAMFDKVISNPTDTNSTAATMSTVAATTATTTSTSTIELIASENKIMTQRSSLLDRMIAEDKAEEKDAKSTTTKENGKYLSSAFASNEVIDHLENILMLDGNKSQNGDAAIKSLTIVPSKRRGGGSLWRKLLCRRKSASKKPALPFAP